MANGDASVQRLRALTHIVVVMMENRSFDHMLGYLTREGMTDLDGLTGSEFNLDSAGRKVPVHAFDAERAQLQRHGEALQKRLDPDHSVAGVRIQLGGGYGTAPNGGFVKGFIESRKPADKVGPDLWMVPMGYYTSKDVPVYDHLARQYCVCDRWYAAVPGDTWPNRLHAVTGTEGPRILEQSEVWGALSHLPFAAQLAGLPLFDVPAFTHQLTADKWCWYAHDPATLHLVDSAYRDLANPMRDNFAFFDRRKVDLVTEIVEAPIVRGGSFLDDAARGELPKVSWIDPSFVDLSVLETSSNDDHPPSDIRAGQAFVLDVYDALRSSPAWNDTMLIVTYDEHGGFYDHVSPPPLPPDIAATYPVSGVHDAYRTYGVRVPALIAGPRVARQVLHEAAPAGQPQYDHTSLVKTILLAAAADPDAALAQMPLRVQRAPHLGGVLLDGPRDDADDPRNARDLIDSWRLAARRARTAGVRSAAAPDAPVRSSAPDGAGQPTILTDFQGEWQKAATALRSLGIHV